MMRLGGSRRSEKLGIQRPSSAGVFRFMRRQTCNSRKKTNRCASRSVRFKVRTGGVVVRLVTVLIVFALVALVLVFTSISSRETGVVASGLPGVTEIFSAALFNGDDSALADLTAAWNVGDDQPLPEGFSDEVMSATSQQFWVSNDGGVVGYVQELDSAQALGALKEALTSRGWIAVESGSDAASTFVKGEGTYRWIAATTTEVSGATSVVLVLEKKGNSDGS